MRRKLKNNKGFAMAELLAVSMVILLLFSILFSNYLPLVAEYENRLSYNDVTAEYAGYYVRKMYLTDNNELSSSTKTSINNGIGSTSFFKVYDKNGNNRVCDQYISGFDGDDKNSAKKYCNSILEEYGVEEIIITNYSMTNVKSKYTESSGKLYKYIKYLPEYKNTIYKGDTDLYRIILKTKDGYATTPIDTDYYTPGSCFVGRSVSGGIEITKYSMSGSDCGSSVTIRKDKKLTMKDSSGKSITGKIVSIGNNAFKGLGVTSINLNGMVKSIGASAFEGSKLESNSINLTGVTSIGDSAFKNTQISSIDIPSSVTEVGKEAFANNSKLTSIKINNSVVSEGEFMNSGDNSVSSYINLGSVTKISKNMFYNFKFSSDSAIVMSNVTSIDESAFASDAIQKINNISISKVTSVGNKAFYNLDIKNLVLGNISSMGDKAFALSSVSSNTLPNVNLSSVTTLGASAFENRKITKLDFGSSSIASISKSAFKSCDISDVTFSDKITSVGESSFEGNSFNKIDFPSSLTNIGVNAFKGNTIITSLDLPASLNVIGNGAFDSWSLLETIQNNSTSFNDYNNWCMVVASGDTSCKAEKSDTGYAIGIGDRTINVVNSNSNKTSENGGNGNE